jgi:uncharacterized protein (TIGR00661 family)
MGRLVISLSGEGRGHASRVITLLDLLQQRAGCHGLQRYEALVLSPRHLLSFLVQSVRRDNVSFHPLPSMHFHYGNLGRLSYMRSLAAAAPFAFRLRKILGELRSVVERFQPDLAICDFEPLLPRISAAMGLKCLSLDHQHFLTAVDPKALPLDLRLKLLFLRPSVKLFCPSADRYLVSSFYQFPQRAGTDHCRQVGILLRSELACGKMKERNFVLAYVRRGPSNLWVNQLAKLPLEVRAYGTDRQGRVGNLLFQPISTDQFLQDLLDCKCLITTAGNQLIGEALAIGKPVLAIPEPGNMEQQLNAHFLVESGLGETLHPSQVSAPRVCQFLEKLEDLTPMVRRFNRIGNRKVLDEVVDMLGEAGRYPSATFQEPTHDPQSKGIAV